eukprot:g21084.t1
MNECCLTSAAGRAWLLGLSRTGLYRVPTAEEGCLLALEESRHHGGSHHRRDFAVVGPVEVFPEAASTPAPDGSVSSVQSVEDLLENSAAQLRRFEDRLVSGQRQQSAVETTYLPTYEAVVEEARRVCEWLQSVPLQQQWKTIGRVTIGTLAELAAAGELGSPENPAVHAVGVAVEHCATRFAPESACTLKLHLVTAFMARRSKLLLKLSSQVRVEVVPWFAVLAGAFDQQQQQQKATENGDAEPSSPSASAVNPVAQGVYRVHLARFAGMQLPNRLVRLLGEYLGCTGLVKEIAADIFEGAFRGTFGAQAKQRETILGPGTPYGHYYEAVLVDFPDDAPSHTVRVDELGGLWLGPTQRGRRSVLANGIAIERVAVSTTHHLLHLLVGLGLDRDAALLEVAAGVPLSRLVKGLRSKSTRHAFPLDESRRSAAARRAFLVFASLLKKMEKKKNAATGNNSMKEEEEEVGGGEGLPASLLEHLKQEVASAATAADLPEERAAVLRDLVFALEGV